MMWSNVFKVKSRLRALLERTTWGYLWLVRRQTGSNGPSGNPKAQWCNAVLKSNEESIEAIRQVQELGLPLVNNPPKNWDTLAALDIILRTTSKTAKIFDAGGEVYSQILPWLALYGYRRLVAGNLVFSKPFRKGPILYRHVDITHTDMAGDSVNAIACLSVIEHGVDLNAYFQEMSRILKPGGILVTSADYFENPIDTTGKAAYGAPVHVFDKKEITSALQIAANYQLFPTSPIDLKCNEKVVCWKEYDLNYTFIIFTLQKRGS